MTRLTKYIAIIFALLGSMLLSACVEESPLIDRSGSYKKPPAPPVGIVATPYSRSADLEWDNVPYATYYNIYVSESNKISTDNCSTLPDCRVIISTLSSASLDGLENGTKYNILVAAVNFYGESSASNMVTVTPTISVPRSPSGVVVVESDSQVRLSWDSTEDAITYRVYSSSDPNIDIVNYESLAEGGMIEVTNLSVDIAGLTNNLNYYFIITALNEVGESVPNPAIIASPQVLPTAIISVTMGGIARDITIELYNQLAPITVANFKSYADPPPDSPADSPFYNGTIFHDIANDTESGSYIQAGGYGPDMVKKVTNGPIQNESNNGLSNLKYTIAMARDADNPDSATSQFFINTFDNIFKDYADAINSGYTVFGRVIAGKDVVDSIAGVETSPYSAIHQNVPVYDIVINSITVDYNP